MLHDGNRINGHPRSEESVKLISEYLIKCHQDDDDDDDDNSLFVRFCELQNRIDSLECILQATWNSFLNVCEQNRNVKENKDGNN